jgi:hypothetical protein
MCKSRTANTRLAVLSASLLLVVLLGVGCPAIENPTGKSKVTTILTADESQLKAFVEAAFKGGPGPVPIGDIESLFVTVTKVVLVPADDDDDLEEENGEEGETEDKGVKGDDDDDSSHVVVFEGSLEVDLLNLMDVSEVLSSAEVPAGTYNQVRLHIENPRLFLASDPETEDTNIQLTANGRLFVTGQFTLPPGQESLIVLDFGGIHLVRTGNGDYVLTPQLSATVSVSDAAVTATGIVADLDTDANTFTLLLTEGELAVSYADDVEVLLPDASPGSEADLADGLEVQVTGTLQPDGSVVADSIQILTEEEEEEE